MMKKIVLAILILTGIYMIGCTKGIGGETVPCTNLPVTADSAALLKFATADSIMAVKDSSGLYYQIIDSGKGSSPLPYSSLFVTYRAQLMDGTVFDSATNAVNTGFVLDHLIAGWQIGIPKIKTGGHIKLLIPSALAYGCNGSGIAVPGNAPVYFDVTLVSWQ